MRTYSVFICMILLIIISNSSQMKFERAPYFDKVSQPVIGILTQPLSGYFNRVYKSTKNKGYIASSYKKWVEQTGARAVTIPHWVSMDYLEDLLREVNGLLIPGGSTILKYRYSNRITQETAKKANTS